MICGLSNATTEERVLLLIVKTAYVTSAKPSNQRFEIDWRKKINAENWQMRIIRIPGCSIKSTWSAKKKLTFLSLKDSKKEALGRQV